MNAIGSSFLLSSQTSNSSLDAFTYGMALRMMMFMCFVGIEHTMLGDFDALLFLGVIFHLDATGISLHWSCSTDFVEAVILLGS